MPAQIPNMQAIHTVGSQFNQNVFKTANHKIMRQGLRNAIADRRTEVNRNNSRQTWANGVENTLKTAHAAAQQHAKTQQSAAMKAQKAHAQGVNSGRVAPTAGTAPRTFAMGSTPAQKAAAKNQATQVNHAHGQALAHVAGQEKVLQQQRNFAHGQAITEANQRARMATKKVNTPPAKPSTPTKTGKPSGTLGPQMADTSSKDNSPYPTAHFPEGASKQVLPHLSESLSNPGKPQSFTQGTYTMKPGGIAAKGSQLEGWAQTKSRAVQARQASKRAGGRNRDLSTVAREWESAANKPMDLEG